MEIKYTTAPVIVIESTSTLPEIVKATVGTRYNTQYCKFAELKDVSGYSIVKTHLVKGDKVYVFNKTTLELMFFSGFNVETMESSLELLDMLSSNFNIQILETLEPNF